MFLFHRRFSQQNNLYIIFSLLLAAGFLIQIKVLYHSHQKNLRLAEYKDRINDLSENMDSVKRIANRTSHMMNKLQASVRATRLKRRMEIS